ncbi:MAG: MlaD family protein [Chryseolinea sp.]
MKETSNKRAVMVGLFVIIGVIILIAGVLMIGSLHETFKKKMQVVARFDDVAGLQSGNNVWFSGVKIGTVGKLNFYKESQVEVIVNIELKAQEYIRKNARIKIGTDGLIGNKILIIYGGTSGAGQIEGGDTLQVEKTFSQEDMVNTLQENNKNILSVTFDLKALSKKIADGEGTIGKLIGDDAVYENVAAATTSLRAASTDAAKLMASMQTLSEGLNKKGTLAHELANDTTVFKSLQSSVQQFRKMADTASAVINNLQVAEKNPNTAIGVLLHDKETGDHIKVIVKNLESSSKTLNEDLIAAQHNFFLRGYFKGKDKAASKNAVEK